jgi:hypothetical protein
LSTPKCGGGIYLGRTNNLRNPSPVGEDSSRGYCKANILLSPFKENGENLNVSTERISNL